MIKKLIINGDDFGMTQGTTLGILVAHEQGILTSTTIMMNMPYASWALEKAKAYPHLGIGVHLNITAGDPMVKGPNSFVNEAGHFIRPKDYPEGKPQPDPEELYKEWKTQIEAFIKATGHKPTHLDSHHHVHMQENTEAVIMKLAKEYDLPIRSTRPLLKDYPYIPCITTFYSDHATLPYLEKLLSQDEEAIEIMAHPALLDETLYETSSYALPRMKELAFLESQEIKQFIKENHIALINYSNIKK